MVIDCYIVCLGYYFIISVIYIDRCIIIFNLNVLDSMGFVLWVL